MRVERQVTVQQVHVEGLGFPEGPVQLEDGSIAFVDLLHAKVRIYREGHCRDLCAVPGAPNGMRLGPDGDLYVCNNGGIAPLKDGGLRVAEPQINGRLQRIEQNGSIHDFAVALPGGGPWRPNDLIFTPQGDIVFTDPQNWEVMAQPELMHTYQGGQLLIASPQGDVKRLAKMTGFPNGLVFHPDGSLLVGLSFENRVVRFEWKDNSVGERSEWCRFDAPFRPDGMVFQDDRIFVTGSLGDAVAVLDLDGRIVEMIPTGAGSHPTNCCLQGTTLWVTMGLAGQLVSIDVRHLLS